MDQLRQIDEVACRLPQLSGNSRCGIVYGRLRQLLEQDNLMDPKNTEDPQRKTSDGSEG